MAKFIGDLQTADFGPNWADGMQNLWQQFKNGFKGAGKAAVETATKKPPTVFQGTRQAATYQPGQVNTTLLPPAPPKAPPAIPTVLPNAAPVQGTRPATVLPTTASPTQAAPVGTRPAAPYITVPQPLPVQQPLQPRRQPVAPATATQDAGVGRGGNVEVPEELAMPDGMEPGFWASLTPLQKGLIYGGGGVAGATALGLNPLAPRRQY